MIILRKTIRSSRWWFILRRIIIHKVTMTIIFRMKWTLHTWTHLSRTLLLLSGSNLGWLGAFDIGYNSPPDDYFDLFCTVISRFRAKSVMLADADVGFGSSLSMRFSPTRGIVSITNGNGSYRDTFNYPDNFCLWSLRFNLLSYAILLSGPISPVHILWNFSDQRCDELATATGRSINSYTQAPTTILCNLGFV